LKSPFKNQTASITHLSPAGTAPSSWSHLPSINDRLSAEEIADLKVHPDYIRENALQKNLPLIALVSFLNDWSSEVVSRILPIYAKSLGVPGIGVGALQGLPDAVSVFLKFFSGIWADKMGRYKPLAVLGYGISLFGRILLAFATSWTHLMGTKTLDRTGKGLRVSPREALLAGSTKTQHGWAFGLNRAFNAIGSIFGLFTLGLAILYLSPDSLGEPDIKVIFPTLVIISCVPATLSWLILAFFVLDPRENDSSPKGAPTITREERASETKTARRMFHPSTTIRAFSRWLAPLPREFKIFIFATAVFSLGNGTEAFMTLRAKDVGFSLLEIIEAFIVFNLAAALSAAIVGKIADGFHRKFTLCIGWVFYCITNLGFASFEHISPVQIFSLFALYGMFFGTAEVAAKAYISELLPHGQRGRAFGIFNGIIGLCLLPSSLISGSLWDAYGPRSTFFYGAVMSAIALAILFLHFSDSSEVKRRQSTSF